MEYIEGECLFDFMKVMNDGDGMIEEYGRFIMHQLIDAVEHMHNRDIIHRDIRSDSFMFREDGEIKL